MAIHHEQNHITLLDALFCEEERWDYDDEEETRESENVLSFNECIWRKASNGDLISEDEELLYLFSKERESQLEINPNLPIDRRSAVDWMVRVHVHYGFEALTAILAVNYFDRFVSICEIETERPWMMQLVAVTCLSLAAKVEETQVPLLFDFQVEGAKYVFEAKTIRRMELLILSTLKWKMNPVTPLSFINHIITRLGIKSHLRWEFLRRCETFLLYILVDSRFVGYLPSVLATATMLHVIEQVDYQNQLLHILKLTSEDVNDTYCLIAEISNTSDKDQQNKRKYVQISTHMNSSSTDSTSGPTDSSSPEVQPQRKMLIVLE